MSDSVLPHRRQPTRLLCPWDASGKNTGVGCHFLFQCMKVESENWKWSCSVMSTLSDPMDCSLPGSSIHGVFQARVLEWVIISFSNKESWVSKNWCFWTVVLEKTIESLLDCKIKPVSSKGNQSWIFIGRTDAKAEAPILWSPDVNNWLLRKDPDARQDWGQEEKGTTEDDMFSWDHRLNGPEFE